MFPRSRANSDPFFAEIHQTMFHSIALGHFLSIYYIRKSHDPLGWCRADFDHMEQNYINNLVELHAKNIQGKTE